MSYPEQVSMVAVSIQNIPSIKHTYPTLERHTNISYQKSREAEARFVVVSMYIKQTKNRLKTEIDVDRIEFA